ncbi:MAG: hypothetical protein V1777_05040 [Candidatus Micrarchaeota archaeon]
MKNAFLVLALVLFLAIPTVFAAMPNTSVSSYTTVKELRQTTQSARQNLLTAKQNLLTAQANQITGMKKLALAKTVNYLAAEREQMAERISTLKKDGVFQLNAVCDFGPLPMLPPIADLNSDTNSVDINKLKSYWNNWKEKGRLCLSEIKNKRAELLLTQSQALLSKAETILAKIKASSVYASNDRVKTLADKLSERVTRLKTSVSELQAKNPHPDNFWGQAHRLANNANQTVRQVRKLALAVLNLETKEQAKISEANTELNTTATQVSTVSDAAFTVQASAEPLPTDSQLQTQIEQADQTEDVSDLVQTATAGGASS